MHPCKPHTESSHKLELQAYPVIHIYTTPPTFSSSILPLFPCPIRGPSRRGSEQQQAPRSCTASYICFCPAQRPSLSLLFPKAEGRATKEIRRPHTITSICSLSSSSLLGQPCSFRNTSWKSVFLQEPAGWSSERQCDQKVPLLLSFSTFSFLCFLPCLHLHN